MQTNLSDFFAGLDYSRDRSFACGQYVSHICAPAPTKAQDGVERISFGCVETNARQPFGEIIWQVLFKNGLYKPTINDEYILKKTFDESKVRRASNSCRPTTHLHRRSDGEIFWFLHCCMFANGTSNLFYEIKAAEFLDELDEEDKDKARRRPSSRALSPLPAAQQRRAVLTAVLTEQPSECFLETI